MSARKILLWVLSVLSFAALIIPILIERVYQSDRQAGWITHLPTSDSSSCITSSGKILVDGQGNVWITGTGPCDTTYDIYVYNGESWTSMGKNRGVLLALDGQGRIWKLTEVKNEQNQVSTIEIAVFEAGNWSNFTTVLSQALRRNFQFTNTLAIDGQGRVWVGFYWSSKTGNRGPGVSVFDGQKWTTYVPNNSGLVGDGSVLAMAIDRQHRAWISTDKGGLSVFDGQAWTNYTGENFDLPYTANITSIAFDREGDAWLGTEHGDVIADEGDQWIKYRLDNCSMYPCHPYIAFDQHGGAWIATGKGVSAFDGETWTTLTSKNSGLAGNSITAVSVDREGRIWFGTNGGISVMEPDETGTVPITLITLSSFFSRGASWFIPFILISLWLAALLNILRGVGAGVAFGLLSSLCFGLLLSDRMMYIFAFPSPVVLSTLGGVTGGMIGGIIDRWRGRIRLSIPLAITGSIVGFVLAFIFLLLLSVG